MQRKILATLLLLCAACSLPKGVHDGEPDYSPMVKSNYKAINEWVIGTRCVECHNSKRKEKDIDLSSYEKIFDNDIFPPLIVPGNPEQSSLYDSIVKGRMPKGFNKLKPSEIESIYNWIKSGAKKSETSKSDPDCEKDKEPGCSGKPKDPGGPNESSKQDPNEPGD